MNTKLMRHSHVKPLPPPLAAAAAAAAVAAIVIVVTVKSEIMVEAKFRSSLYADLFIRKSCLL
jgi:hypothetical protein